MIEGVNAGLKPAVSPKQATVQTPAPVKTAQAQEYVKSSGPKVTASQIKQAVSMVNKQIENTAVSLQYNSKIDMMIVRVVDKQTGKQVSQLPGESVVRMKESFADLSGMLVNKKV